MRKLTRYFLVFTLVFCVICTHVNEASAAKPLFKDVPANHYAYDSIKWAKDFGVIGGYPDGTFKPNQVITEQQFAAILVNYFDLEKVDTKLKKHTPTKSTSDAYYQTLAAYSVPLNGYFSNTIRGKAVKRGVVAQAIAHVADGKQNLSKSITFLLDHGISNGQNPQFEHKNLAKFFGATNSITRAQVVSLFHRLDEKNYHYLSDDAENSYINQSKKSLVDRANMAKNQVDRSLKVGPSTDTPNNSWNGNYAYYYRWGTGEFDQSGRNLTISKTTDKNFYIQFETFDGSFNGNVEGYATILSKTKAMMYEPTNGNGDRCVIEFEKLSTAIKITELDCESERGANTSYSGTLKKK